MNGKVKIEAIDDDGDGSPDRHVVSISVSKAAIVSITAVILAALGYNVV